MRHYFALCFLLATTELLLLHHIPLATASVEETCKDAASDDPNIDYNFCLTSLRSDPQSGSANNKSLASIAASLASDSASSTSAKIDTLLASGPGDAKKKEALKSCKSNYDDMNSKLSDAKAAIDSNSLDSAKKYLIAAMEFPRECEQVFTEFDPTLPLMKAQVHAEHLAAIASAITFRL